MYIKNSLFVVYGYKKMKHPIDAITTKNGFKYERFTLAANIFRGTAYIPVLGVIIQSVAFIGVAILVVAFNKNKSFSESTEDYCFLAIFASRVVISGSCPFVLPIIDTVVSVWREKERKKCKVANDSLP